jgi:hypothetical protein
MFGMEYDQRMIIKFLWNERADARDIAPRLQAQSAEHAFQLPKVQIWIAEIWFSRQDLHDETHTRKSPLDDFGAKFLIIWDKYLFESAHSIAIRLLVAHPTVLRYFHEFIGFNSLHLH